MSVISMKKVQLFTHQSDVERVLEMIQAMGMIEFRPIINFRESAEVTEIREMPQSSELNRIAQAITFLNNYEPKLGTWTKLVEGTSIDILESELNTKVTEVGSLSRILNDIEEVQGEFIYNSEQLRQLNENKNILVKWQKTSAVLSKLNTEYTKTYFITKKESNQKSDKQVKVDFIKEIESVLEKVGISAYVESVGVDLASVTILKNDKINDQFVKIVQSNGGEMAQLPALTGTPAEEIVNLNKEIAILETKKIEIETKLFQLAKEQLNVLKIAYDTFLWKKERNEVSRVAKATKNVVILEGWCDEHGLPNLKEKITKNNILCEIKEIIANEGEEPPVELRNNATIQPFEIITRLYGLPTHRDIDPTPFLAGFFFLFFGLSLTDVGYGLFLMVVALVVLFYFKVPPIIKLFGKLLFLMGLSSALVGLLFGGYLGIEASKLPAWLQAIQVFDPIGNPLPVFYLALALGVVQVMFGMVLRIYSDARNKMLMTGMLDQGPWLLLFTSLIFYGASVLGYINFVTSDDVLILVYLSLITVVVSSGRTGKTVLGKIQMSLLSLYNSIGYFSDILSYSRLLALGLATSALAFAVNLIAEIVSEMIPYVGFILAIIILIVGHLFTLVVNTLGAFIHSARLQFVEFFGKFITGTGQNFKPLTRKETYINIVKDSS